MRAFIQRGWGGRNSGCHECKRCKCVEKELLDTKIDRTYRKKINYVHNLVLHRYIKKY